MKKRFRVYFKTNESIILIILVILLAVVIGILLWCAQEALTAVGIFFGDNMRLVCHGGGIGRHRSSDGCAGSYADYQTLRDRLRIIHYYRGAFFYRLASAQQSAEIRGLCGLCHGRYNYRRSHQRRSRRTVYPGA